MQFAVAFQKLGNDDLRHGKCHANSPSDLVRLLLRHGYHAVTYHEVADDPEDVRHIQMGEEKEEPDVC